MVLFDTAGSTLIDMKTFETRLDQLLDYIRRNPGVHACDINRALGLDFSWKLRLALLDRRLVRRQIDGSAVRYFARTNQGGVNPTVAMAVGDR